MSIHRPAYAGYRALLLLQRQAPEVVAALSGDIWRRWAPILVTFPWLRDDREGDGVQVAHDALMRMAYPHAADEIIAIFLAQLRQQNRETDYLHRLHRVQACWDDRFADAVVRAIQHGRFRPTILQTLLAALIDHGAPGARAYAQALIARRARGEDAHLQAVLAARVLLVHADDAGWPNVWPAFQQDPEFGREAILGLHRVPSGASAIAQRLADEQVADLFIWLASLFPPSEDPPLPQGWVSDEQHVVMWRNSLITDLQQRRTAGACEALRHVVLTYPEYDWLKWQLQEAEELLRYDAWRPATPETIFNLAEDGDRRLVESGEQLLDVIVESLDHLQHELQGETPSVVFLWNETTRDGKIYVPKDENTLSDYVKLHLDRDLRQRGIVANREVQIRSGRGSKGERTDIHVDAVLPRSAAGLHSSVTAIIEVKGCWHRDVLGAMETQLVERYLRDNQCRYGLYLVGWYVCPLWDRQDSRKRDTPPLSCVEAQEQFVTQAIELSRRPGREVQVKSFVLNTALR